MLSPDGYVRMPLATLDALSFDHLFSQCDDEFLQELCAQTVPAAVAGFSEWKSRTDPAISLGWGWFVHSRSQRVLLAPENVRSNVMLIDARGYDLGPVQTANLFRLWLDGLSWQDSVGTVLPEVPPVNFAS